VHCCSIQHFQECNCIIIFKAALHHDNTKRVHPHHNHNQFPSHLSRWQGMSVAHNQHSPLILPWHLHPSSTILSQPLTLSQPSHLSRPQPSTLSHQPSTISHPPSHPQTSSATQLLSHPTPQSSNPSIQFHSHPTLQPLSFLRLPLLHRYLSHIYITQPPPHISHQHQMPPSHGHQIPVPPNTQPSNYPSTRKVFIHSPQAY